MKRRRVTVALRALPVALALVTAVVIVSALLGDGGWDALSWLLLAIPVGVCLWFGTVRRTVRTSAP